MGLYSGVGLYLEAGIYSARDGLILRVGFYSGVGSYSGWVSTQGGLILRTEHYIIMTFLEHTGNLYSLDRGSKQWTTICQQQDHRKLQEGH